MKDKITITKTRRMKNIEMIDIEIEIEESIKIKGITMDKVTKGIMNIQEEKAIDIIIKNIPIPKINHLNTKELKNLIIMKKIRNIE